MVGGYQNDVWCLELSVVFRAVGCDKYGWWSSLWLVEFTIVGGIQNNLVAIGMVGGDQNDG
jgi:hypothetical protein